MDPNAALLRYRRAFEAKDHQEAREAFFVFVDWLIKGGAPPTEPMTPREARVFAGSISAILGKVPDLLILPDSEPN